MTTPVFIKNGGIYAMIETLLAHVVGKNFAGKNENVKARFLYCKSLFFLSAILILVNSLFWDIGTSIGALLGDQLKLYVLSISKIGVHLFTSLSIIAFVIWLPSTIVYAISEHVLYAYKKDIKIFNLSAGSGFRLSSSLDYVLIFFFIGFVFDHSFFNEYTNTYPDWLWGLVLLLCGLHFFSTSLVGVINRFFVFHCESE